MTQAPSAHAGSSTWPGTSNGRYATLDALRGFAVLGILLRNVFVFGLPTSAFAVPQLWSVDPAAATAAWAFIELFVDGAMRGLFSMMFGASALLILMRSETANSTVSAADLFYRRQFWLVLFGMVHAYLLLSPIDVLSIYGMLGLAIYPLRNVRARNLLIVAGASLLVVAAVTTFALSISFDENSQQAQASGQSFTHAASTGEQSGQAEGKPQAEDESLEQNWLTEIADRREGYLFNIVTLAESSFDNHTSELFKTHLVDIGALMLIGMALFKLGILTGRRSRRFYVILMLAGYLFGISVNGIEILAQIAGTEDPAFDSNWTMITYDFGRTAIALGHVGAIMLFVRLNVFRGLVELLKATGRLALTNYILQTVICTTLFFGHGLALYGSFDHHQLLGIAVTIAVLQMIGSWMYLRMFRQGPLEWLLRRLINWRTAMPAVSAGQPGIGAL